MLTPSANVRIQLVSSAGNPYPVSQSGVYLYCSSANGTYYQSVSIPQGSSYVDFAVVPATYNCSTYLPDVTTGGATVNAVRAGLTEGTIVVTVPDSSITVSLFDSVTFEPVAALDNNQTQFSCYDNTNQRGFYKYFQKGETILVLGVIAGTYSCSINFPGTRSDSFTAQVSTGANADYAVRVEKLISNIHFNFVRSSGAPFTVPNLGNSWAQVSCTNLPGRSKWYSASLMKGDSDARVNIVPGRYACRMNSELFSSDEIEVAVPGAGEVSASMEVIEYSTRVTFSLVDMQGTSVIPPNNTTANIYCSEPGGRYKYVNIAANTYSVTTNLGEGSYKCALSGSGVSSDQFDLVISGTESALQVDVLTSSGNSALTVNLYNADTQQPMVIGSNQYAELACWNQFDTFSRFSSRYDPQTSSTTIYFPEGTFDCSVYLQGFASEQFRIVTGRGMSQSRNLQVLPPDSFIRTRLLQGNTDQSFTLPDGLSGYLNCRIDNNDAQGIYFGGQINAGDSMVTLGVRNGSYLCSVWIPGYGATDFRASVTSGTTTENFTRIFSESSEVDVEVIDKSSRSAASGIPLKIYASTRNRLDESSKLQHWQEVSTQSGVARLNLIPDLNYEIGVRIDESYGAASERSIVLPDELTLIRTSSASTPQKVTIEATETRTFVDVRLLYPDGTTVQRGWANISSVVSTPDEVSSWEGAQIVNGRAKIPAIAGKPYLVSAYQAFEGTKEWIEPRPEQVTLTEGETRVVTFVLTRPNYQLNVNLVITGTQPPGVPQVYCYTIDNQNCQSYAQLDSTLKATIPLAVNSGTNSIEVSCSAYYPDLKFCIQ